MLGEYDFEVRKETGNKMTIQSVTEILEENSRFFFLEPFWKLCVKLKVTQITYVGFNFTILQMAVKIWILAWCVKAKHCWRLSTNFLFSVQLIQSKTLILNWRKKSNFFALGVLWSDSMKQNHGGFTFKSIAELFPIKFFWFGDRLIKFVNDLFLHWPLKYFIKILKISLWNCNKNLQIKRISTV